MYTVESRIEVAVGVLYDCMCSHWLCWFGQRIRIRKIYIFLVIFAHFSFDIAFALGRRSTIFRGYVRASTYIYLYVCICECGLTRNSFGYEIKLMLRYHSVFHSSTFFCLSFLLRLLGRWRSFASSVLFSFTTRSCSPQHNKQTTAISVELQKLLQRDEKWIEDVNNNDRFDSICDEWDGHCKWLGVWFIGQLWLENIIKDSNRTINLQCLHRYTYVKLGLWNFSAIFLFTRANRSK